MSLVRVSRPVDPAAVPPAHSRARAVLALLHPGPSLLVTACFVAAAAAARHHLPDLLTSLRLAAVMLPQQFAIGALNDLCDRDLDRRAKPAKPLTSGALRPSVAWMVTGAGFAIALGVAGTFPLPTLPLACACVAAGAAYDLGLKRGPLSWLPYWIGFSCLPLTAGAAVQHLTLRVAIAAPPLALLLALSLHLANAMPDIATDRRAGATGLAVRFGWLWSRWLSLGLAGLAAVGAVVAAPALDQPALAVLLGALPLLAVALVLAMRPTPRPFPLLAPAGAILAAVWLVALP